MPELGQTPFGVEIGQGSGGGGVDLSALKFILQTANALTPNAQALSALATGLLKVTNGMGVLSSPSAGVDFALAPLKTFSTTRLAAAAQTLSIPVVDGENNGLIIATGRLISDGTARDCKIKINGSSTNVFQQYLVAQNAVVGAARTALVMSTGVSHCIFFMVFNTAKTADALKRAGVFISLSCAAAQVDQVIFAGVDFSDTTNTITTIDIDCGFATGLAAKSYVLTMEGIIS